MLRQLTVRDFAQVKSLDIELDGGLTVITGESGAGKSILFGALGLVLGARADTSSIRPGAERSEVSAEFDLSNNPAALRFLEDHELSDPELAGRCLLRRTVARGGRRRNRSHRPLALLRRPDRTHRVASAIAQLARRR